MQSMIIKRLSALTLAICLLASPSYAEKLHREKIVDLYSQAKEMFREANTLAAKDPAGARALYQKSLMRYERIVKEGKIGNGKLFYNMGNIYFHIKDIGRAILNYRRAQQYIPNDPNLKQNLDYARSIRMDRIEEKQKTQILKTLFFWHYDLSTRTRVYILTFSFILLWLLAMVRLFIHKSFLVWFLVFTAFFSTLFAGSLFIDTIYLSRIRPGVIISSPVIARKGNSDTYEPSFKEPLHSGTEFTLIEKRGNWYQIELSDSRKCWVPEKDIEFVR
jgi:tetratricopeptide (TPR) repeat protein